MYLALLGVSWQFATVWSGNGAELLSTQQHAATPAAHHARCQPIVELGFRPTSVSALQTAPGLPPVVASVWWESGTAKERLGRRKANAAVALARLGKFDSIYSILRQGEEPDARSFFIDRAARFDLDSDTLVAELLKKTDPNIQPALILALGQFPRDNTFSKEQLDKIVSTLLVLYRDNPEPGLHGAAQWLLHHWGRDAELAQIQSSLATGQIEGNRRWYINEQGQSMIVLDVPDKEIRPASRGDLAVMENSELPRNETLPRRFAVSSTEVTRDQYLHLVPSFRHDQMYRSPRGDCPILGITWHDAAKYCNELSKAEGIELSQWCYVRVPGEQDLFVEADDWLAKTGYRLPSEAEWEYACRAGTVTDRYYGRADELLDRYAWCAAQTGRTMPVASLKPNDWGLFDMLGNVMEWCQDRCVAESTQQAPLDKRGEDGAASGGNAQVRRPLRGGSLFLSAREIRASFRGTSLPAGKGAEYGFRVARTCPRP